MTGDGKVGEQVLGRWVAGSKGKGNTAESKSRHSLKSLAFSMGSFLLLHPKVEWDMDTGWMEVDWVSAQRVQDTSRQPLETPHDC